MGVELVRVKLRKKRKKKKGHKNNKIKDKPHVDYTCASVNEVSWTLKRCKQHEW
jgi:hypothetical protein